jgi:recombination protein RecR
MALHLLERDREGARRILDNLHAALEGIGHCALCRNLSETEICTLCKHPRRDTGLLCIVETPADVIAVEQAGSFNGLYYVLMGHLSPLDGIGPGELGLDQLEQRFSTGQINEVILATNSTVEGEATAHFIAELARENAIRTTRIAYGVPLGGELEYIDGGTLVHAFSGRREF